ncbi:TPA: phage tail protein, partial [Stenotrophomonas maltophilia]
MDMVCDHIGGMRIEDPVTGLTKLVLVRPDYDPATLAEIGPGQIIEMMEWQQPMLENSVNEITVVYRDIATNKDAAVTYQNLA